MGQSKKEVKINNDFVDEADSIPDNLSPVTEIDNQAFLDLIFRKFHRILLEPAKLESRLERRKEAFHYFLSIWNELGRAIIAQRQQNPDQEKLPTDMARRLYVSAAAYYLNWDTFDWSFLSNGPLSLAKIEESILNTQNLDFDPKEDFMTLLRKMFEFKVAQPMLDFKEVF